MERSKSQDLSRVSEFLIPRLTDDLNEAGLVEANGLFLLYRPSEYAVADMIFVHGLGEGCRTTWTKNAELALFWPQMWLRLDPDFRDVMIYTFGYDSKWRRDGGFNVTDDAKSLLQCVMHRPGSPTGTEVRPPLSLRLNT